MSDNIGIALLCILIMFLAFFSRIQGVGNLNSEELNTIVDITETVCKENDGFKKVEFFPSTRYEVDVFCNNGAIFNDISYLSWKKNKK